MIAAPTGVCLAAWLYRHSLLGQSGLASVALAGTFAGPVLAPDLVVGHTIEVAASAVETGRDEVRNETGLDERTFNDRAAPAEAKTRTHYLNKFIEDGQEVVCVLEWAPDL